MHRYRQRKIKPFQPLFPFWQRYRLNAHKGVGQFPQHSCRHQIGDYGVGRLLDLVEVMTLRIQVTRDEFDAAESSGAVYGLLKGRRGLYVYVELGLEEEYIPRHDDDPKTEYRKFLHCNTFFAATIEQLEAGRSEVERYDVTVIIYC